MELHWTYEEIGPENDDLMQGDIISLTDDIQRILDSSGSVPRGLSCFGYVVLTQCCDLVRRKGDACKAPYIALAIICDFEDFVEVLLENVCKKLAPNIYSSASKGSAKDTLARILNQNEQAFGLFYLHPSDLAGIEVSRVALLRCACSVSSSDNYSILLQARTGRLKAEFRHKFGWLVGNLYSRVGTPDWSDHANGSSALGLIIDKVIMTDSYIWVEESSFRHLAKMNINFDGKSRDEIIGLIESNRPEPIKETVAKEIRAQLNNLLDKSAQAIADDTAQRIAECLIEHNVEASEEEVRMSVQSIVGDFAQYVSICVAQSLGKKLASWKISEGPESNVVAGQIGDILQPYILEYLRSLPEKHSNRMLNSNILNSIKHKNDSY